MMISHSPFPHGFPGRPNVREHGVDNPVDTSFFAVALEEIANVGANIHEPKGARGIDFLGEEGRM
jgi:hypothetical protein